MSILEWFQIDAWHYYLLWCLVLTIVLVLTLCVTIPAAITEGMLSEDKESTVTNGCMRLFMVPLRMLLGGIFTYNAYMLGFLFLSGWLACGTLCTFWNPIRDKLREKRAKGK